MMKESGEIDDGDDEKMVEEDSEIKKNKDD
jgi:hypothetical protein